MSCWSALIAGCKKKGNEVASGSGSAGSGSAAAAGSGSAAAGGLRGAAGSAAGSGSAAAGSGSAAAGSGSAAPIVATPVTTRAEFDAVLTAVDYPKPQTMPGTSYLKPKAAETCVALGGDVVTATKREDLDVDGDGTTDVIYETNTDKLVTGGDDMIEESIIVARHGDCLALMGTAPGKPDKIAILEPGKPATLEVTAPGYIYKLKFVDGAWQTTELKVEGDGGAFGDYQPAKDFVAKGGQ